MADTKTSLSVLFVLPFMHPNIYVATRALAQAGYRVTILSERPPQSQDRDGVTQLPLASTKSGIQQQIKEIAPDITILRGGGRYKAFLARTARRGGSKVIGYFLQSLTHPILWNDRLRRRLLGLPISRVTPIRGRDVNAPTDPIATYLPWPVERDGAYPERDHGEYVRIVCVGQLNQPRKNLHLAVEALTALGRSGRVRLVLVGKSMNKPSGYSADYLKQLEDAAEQEDWIEIRPNVPYEQMADIYRDSDVCVMPSVGEPLGYAPVEAMAYGVIPVISEQAGSVGYIAHGQNGMRVDVDQTGQLEAVLTELVVDSDLRTKLSDGARATAEGELGIAMFLERFRRLVVELKV